MRERFLDGVVAQSIGEKSGFMRMNGYTQELLIREKIGSNYIFYLIPDCSFYVFTTSRGFKFEKEGMELIPHSFGSRRLNYGSSQRVIRDLVTEAKQALESGDGADFYFLFFDEQAKTKFYQKSRRQLTRIMQKNRSPAVEPLEINVARHAPMYIYRLKIS